MKITDIKETETKLYKVTIFPKLQPFSYEIELFVTLTDKYCDVEKMIFNHLQNLTNSDNQMVIEDKGDVNFMFKRDGEKLQRINIMMIDKSEVGGIDVKYLRNAESGFMERHYKLSRVWDMATEAREAQTVQ